MLQAYYNGNCQVPPPPLALSPADSRLNATFTKPTHTPSIVKAPVTTYQMTPADPLNRCDNYDIADLSASDSTDDDEEPKKVNIYIHFFNFLCIQVLCKFYAQSNIKGKTK